MDLELKVLLVGAGAIGSLIGAYMARGGIDVTLLDIGDHIHVVAREGVKVDTISGDSFEVKVKAFSDSRMVEDVDIFILTVKTFHTESALNSLSHLRDRLKCALSIQNGVEKEDHLIRFFGRDRVIGAMCLEGAMRLGPNHIQHTMTGITYVGELDGRETDRVNSVCNLFRSGGLKAEVSPNIISADWAKWINFAAGAAITGLTRLEYYKILKSRELASLFSQIYREYAQLARAKGIEIQDFPGFEVKTISEASPEKAIEILRKRGEGLEARGMTKVKPSLCQDIEAGRRTEYEAIFGYALREAERVGLEMPLTGYVYRLLKGVEESLNGR